MRKLSLKRQRFISEYLTTGNATKAVLKAYPNVSYNSARTMGSRELTKDDTINRMQEIVESGSDSSDAKWIISKLKQNAIESGSNEVRQYSASNQALKILADFMTPQTEQTDQNIGSLDSVALTEVELKKLLEIIDLVGVAALASFIRREMDSVEVIDGEFSEAKSDREI